MEEEVELGEEGVASRKSVKFIKSKVVYCRGVLHTSKIAVETHWYPPARSVFYLGNTL